MKTTVIANMKGGVGKTTIAANLGALLASEYKKKVLLIDLDSSGNLSNFFKVEQPSGSTKGLAELLLNPAADPEDHIMKTRFKRLDILPSNDALSRAETLITIDLTTPQQLRLSKQLKKIEDDYDYCIIDCPPTVNNSILVINALAYADDVLIPCNANRNDLDGARKFMAEINTVKSYNPKLTVRGIVATRITSRAIDKQFIAGGTGLPLLKSFIRENKVGQSAGFSRKTFREEDKKAKASLDMDNLAAEFIGAKFPHPEVFEKGKDKDKDK